MLCLSVRGHGHGGSGGSLSQRLSNCFYCVALLFLPSKGRLVYRVFKFQISGWGTLGYVQLTFAGSAIGSHAVLQCHMNTEDTTLKTSTIHDHGQQNIIIYFLEDFRVPIMLSNIYTYPQRSDSRSYCVEILRNDLLRDTGISMINDTVPVVTPLLIDCKRIWAKFGKLARIVSHSTSYINGSAWGLGSFHSVDFNGKSAIHCTTLHPQPIKPRTRLKRIGKLVR